MKNVDLFWSFFYNLVKNNFDFVDDCTIHSQNDIISITKTDIETIMKWPKIILAFSYLQPSLIFVSNAGTYLRWATSGLHFQYTLLVLAIIIRLGRRRPIVKNAQANSRVVLIYNKTMFLALNQVYYRRYLQLDN